LGPPPPPARPARRLRETVVTPFGDGCPAHAAAEAAFLGAFARCPWGDDPGGVWSAAVRDLMLPTVEAADLSGAAAALARHGGSHLRPTGSASPLTVLHPPGFAAADRLRLALFAPLGSLVRVGGLATLAGYRFDGFSYLQGNPS
jgi:hypothetical protein